MTDAACKALSELLAVMAALRTPGSGCPWDLQQSFATIAPYTIEEAYEVAEAIERSDMPALKDELGDLLLQVVYHARMAEEQGDFAFADVARAITAKMIRRHPHVFGSATERAAGAAPGFWERIKAEEKRERHSVSSPLVGEGQGGGDGRTSIVGGPPTPNPSPQGGGESILDGVPVALPALTRAIKLQNKAAKVGFDWPSLAPVFDKLREELAELEQEIAAGGAKSDQGKPRNQAKITDEFGDLLFVVANVARHLDIDAEAALRAANAKFTRRFGTVERKLADQGRSPGQSTLEEMDQLWDEAKAEERTGRS
jgi:nucleoside triphosphate diphosphatase